MAIAPARQQPRGANDAASADVQIAFYQAPGLVPGSELGLPPFPGSNPNTQVGNYAEPNGMPQALPSMPNAVQLSGGVSAQGNPNPGNPNPGNPNFGNPNFGNAPKYPPQSAAPAPQFNQPQVNQAQFNQPPYDPYATQPSQVYPPPSSPYRTVGAGEDLRAVQNNPNTSSGYPGNELRPAAPMMNGGFGPNSRPLEIATGLPYVTPAPRTGNFPTSPYNGSLFRTVSYQNVAQGGPATGNIANTQPVLPPLQQNLPVAPAPGIYPTQYQCQPGAIPTYPAPGAVPGTYTPPTVTPNMTPGTYSPNNSGYSPIFSLGQENYNVQIGRGIVGQPTVYVPGQYFRNFMRYLSP